MKISDPPTAPQWLIDATTSDGAVTAVIVAEVIATLLLILCS